MDFLSHQLHLPVKEGQEPMLIVALQTVSSHRTQDSTNAANAQCSSQKANVEQNLLLSRFQMVRYVMGVNEEIFEWECHHGKHGCT